MTKTGLYFQDPKYSLRRGVIRDPSLVLDLPLYQLGGASFMSKDAYGHLCTRHGPIWTPRGRDFDGGDDYIGFPNLALGNSFTIELWMNMNGETGSYGGLVGSQGWAAGTGDIHFQHLSASDAITLAVEGVTTTFTSTTVFDSTKYGIPFHLVGVYDGSAGVIAIYVNGILDNSETGLADVTTRLNNPRIGSVYDGSRWWDGLIGEVIIRSRGLTPLEVQHNYLMTKWRYR